jgi:hypothetical protein
MWNDLTRRYTLLFGNPCGGSKSQLKRIDIQLEAFFTVVDWRKEIH